MTIDHALAWTLVLFAVVLYGLVLPVQILAGG